MSLLYSSIILICRPHPVAACYLRTDEVNCRAEGLKHVPVDYLKDKLCKRLDLGRNLIDNLEDTNLTTLKHKQYIEDVLLDHNLIENPSAHFLGQLPDVSLLDMSSNQIKSVEQQFCSMHRLQELILNGNPIKHIDERAFSCLLFLLSIRLADTPIKKLYTHVANLFLSFTY